MPALHITTVIVSLHSMVKVLHYTIVDHMVTGRDSSVVVTMFFIANVDIDTMALTTNSTRYRLDCQ